MSDENGLCMCGHKRKDHVGYVQGLPCAKAGCNCPAFSAFILFRPKDDKTTGLNIHRHIEISHIMALCDDTTEDGRRASCPFADAGVKRNDCG